MHPGSLLVDLTPASDPKTTLFAIHPAGGTLFCYRDLAARIAPDWSMVGVKPPGAEAASDGPLSIEALARLYVAAVKGRKPRGPYNLVGYSFGGNVAFEMALQLQRLGDRVETIVMFDSHPPSCYAGPIPSAEAYALVLPRLACRAMGIDLEALPAGSQSWEGLQHHLMERAGLAAEDWEGDDAGGFEQAWMHHHHALKRHRPSGTFLGDVVYFEAEEPQPEFISELNISVEAGIAEREWKRLCAGGFQHLRVPGDHYTLLSERNAPAIGDALLKAMSVSREMARDRPRTSLS